MCYHSQVTALAASELQTRRAMKYNDDTRFRYPVMNRDDSYTTTDRLSDHFFDLSSEQEGHILIVRVNGRVDGVNSEEFHTRVKEIMDEISPPPPLILNLSGLTYASSAALRILLQIAQDMKKKNLYFALCAPLPEVQNIIECTGFDKIIKTHKDLPTAIRDIT